MKGQDKIVAGRVQLLFTAVFFGTLATGLRLVETEQVPTMGTDGKHLLFNPKFSDKLSKAEILGVLAHEVLHLVFMTHLRMGNKDHKVWNMATDYAINLVLIDEKFTLPEGCLLEEKYRDWSSEKIYAHLMDNPDEQPQVGGWNIGGVSPAGSLGGDEAQALSPEQIEAEMGRMKAKIQSAAMTARKAGTMPGSLDRLIDKICAPKASWKDILQRFLSEKAFNDWDFHQCHTRMLHSYKVISPVLDGDALGKLAIIVDTSGSVDEDQLAQFAGEISDILENYECEVGVVYCDTEVNRTDKFTNDDLPLRLHAVGGGGTKGRPAYDWVYENLEDSAAIIHYTDSFLFDWNEIERPEVPVLMACTSPRPDNSTPSWVEVIDISE